MFSATEIVTDAFVERLQAAYRRNFGTLEPAYGEIMGWAARMALERIAGSTALYHDLEHTVMVTLVGQEMLRGRHIREGGVTPEDWLHATISLLCHDIGYVHGVCRADTATHAATGLDGGLVELPDGATDAWLTPYHVDRGKLFIEERFGGHPTIDARKIRHNIELTRFPVPAAEDPSPEGDFRSLVRAADLVGQLADPGYLRKLPALFREFEETGAHRKLGYHNSADLRRGYAGFYWNMVHPYIGDGLEWLSVTQEGRQWRANLYAHVFAVEHAEV